MFFDMKTYLAKNLKFKFFLSNFVLLYLLPLEHTQEPCLKIAFQINNINNFSLDESGQRHPSFKSSCTGQMDQANKLAVKNSEKCEEIR
ncbi:hypothetical protein BpHYR1_007599 [Brachionus plicatilis]|uniref:Secreted protein n=1 Tax=Brachionus plicatilis TaxID=10195 RepID=A0A3M7R1U6_BRAPC|nr:hypothetical protein BpHYR1_007599 [Brachionus plicatilis]